MPRRPGLNKLQILRVLVDATGPIYGYAIIQATSLASSAVFPILAGLAGDGYVTAEWETIDPSTEQRPRRRNYVLTPAGHEYAYRELADAQERITAAATKPST
jgi:PadR family transcriptional regulator, regulatory protein PadR